MPYQAYRDPRVPYALMDDAGLGDGMRRRAEEQLRLWKELDSRSFEMKQEAERMLSEADDMAFEARRIEQEFAEIWRELGLPYP